MYRVYLCDYDTNEEKLVYYSHSLSDCCDVKTRLTNNLISSNNRFSNGRYVRRSYFIAGEEGRSACDIADSMLDDALQK